ncbi:MAG: RIP metalloprotease RseP [Chlorobi bacterium]|nr:RIP metalloprotease RseP [Chlorobiota bacterium]
MDYIFYFIITIGILVLVHEFGHFAAAKLSGMRVDVFAVGFGKRLFGWNKLTGFTMGDLPKDFDGEGHTDYRLSLLPLGGYVKIAGMIDESFDTEFKNSEPKPYEFRSKSTPKKLFVISAGVLMNLILAILIFWGINYSQGKLVRETTTIGVVADSTNAWELGFRSGDKILSVNGIKVSNWESIISELMVDNVGKNVSVIIDRGGEQKTIEIPKSVIAETSQKGMPFKPAFTKPVIADVLPNSPAEDSGIKPGDIFLGLNGEEILTSRQVIKIVTSHKETDLPITLLRGEDTVKTTVNPGIEGKIGISIVDGAYIGPSKYQSYGFFGALVQSISNIGTYTYLTFDMFKTVIAGDVEFNQVFGGPVKIAKFAAQSAETGMTSFLFFLAMLSLSLAIINILPFPVLDGGHLIIILIEGITGKELPIKVKMGIQQVGLVILLLLMAFIIYNDIISL